LLAAELGDDLAEAAGDFIQRLVPSEALPSLRGGGPPSPAFVAAIPFAAILRMGYSTRSGEYTRSRYLATFAHRKSARHRMLWIALDFGGAPVFHRDHTPQASGQSCGHAAMDNLLHDSYDYTVLPEG